MPGLRVASAQINPTVGDLEGNARLILSAVEEAKGLGADIVSFPELTVPGYPPEDLVFMPRFVSDNLASLDTVAQQIDGIVAIVGFVNEEDGRLFNAAAVIGAGEVQGVYNKILLPNYGVFDERRYFSPGHACPVFEVRGARIGVNVCEDIWERLGPSEIQCAAGAEVIININSSPYEMGKQGVRVGLVTDLARRNHAFAVYTNQVGGQDELVFDGGSMVAGPDGELIATAARFEETVMATDLDIDHARQARAAAGAVVYDEEALSAIGEAVVIEMPPLGPERRPRLVAPAIRRLPRVDAVYRALSLGTRDYVRKTGFEKVAIALSGGIDSTLVGAIAVDALGPDNVIGVSMPSRYSSEGSVADAHELSRRLGIELWTVPIEAAHRAFEEILSEVFEGTEPNVAEENLQARIRGNIMMWVANKFNWLVLTTGNKSEFATGYATLYGDMAGGFAVIKDVPKTLVYELAEHRNQRGPGSPIPQAAIEKPPSAELRPEQFDQDTLPDYDTLDRILSRYVEHRLSPQEIIVGEGAIGPGGADEETVRRVLRLVDTNEYKRRQAPPGVKITGIAFGRDRRMPIASRYRAY